MSLATRTGFFCFSIASMGAFLLNIRYNSYSLITTNIGVAVLAASFATPFLYLLYAASMLYFLANSTTIAIPSYLFWIPFSLVPFGSIAILDGEYKFLLLAALSLTVPIMIVYIAKKTSLKWVIRSVLIAFLVYLGLGIAFPATDLATYGRFTGLSVNPNYFGFNTVVASILFISAAKGSDISYYFGVISFLILSALTGSRIALFCQFIVVLYALIIGPKKRLFLYVIFLFIALIGFILFSQPNINDLSNIGIFNRYEAFGMDLLNVDDARLKAWNLALKSISKNWIFGSGYQSAIDSVGYGNFHNSYLRSLATVGIVLSLPLYATVILLFAKGVKITINNNPLGLYFVVMPVFLFVEDYIFGLNSSFFFFNCLFVGLTVVTSHVRRRSISAN